MHKTTSVHLQSFLCIHYNIAQHRTKWLYMQLC